MPLTRGQLDKLIGRRCMFIVKKNPATRFLPGYGFDVFRVSDDSELIGSCYDEGRDYTPNKVCVMCLLLLRCLSVDIMILYAFVVQSIFQPCFVEKGSAPVLALRAPLAPRRVSPPERIVYKRRGLKKICKSPGSSNAMSASRKSVRLMARRKLLSMFDKISGDAHDV
jgi:hypothetical protein